jgi:VanZ family protein
MRLKVIGESGFRGVDMPVGPWIVIAALSGLFLGIVWEVLEALFLNLSWVDTLSDLVLDMVGAALGGWLAATLAK